MEKPKVILELEKELNCIFELVGNPIEFYSGLRKKISLFSLDEANNIRKIVIYGFGLKNIPKSILINIRTLAYLEYLNLRDNQISNIASLRDLHNLKTLLLYGNPVYEFPYPFEFKKFEKPKEILELEKLFRKEIKQLESKDDFENDNHLFHKLLLGYKFANQNIIGIYLGNCNIKRIDFLVNFLDLKFLSLSNNLIEDISTLQNIKNLEYLYLEHNQVQDISALSNLVNLRELYLNNNQIVDINPLQNLTELNDLNLCNNRIQNLSPIRNLCKISKLALCENPIKKIPEWIINFDKIEIRWNDQTRIYPKSITFYNNPIENIPIEIIKQGKISIKAYFAEQKKTKSIPNPYVKLILTGNTTVGKTSLINFLTKQTFKEGEITTHGVNQCTWKPENSNLDINIWDFGGQEYYHSTHQLFFSNNTLYLLMYDKQHNCNGWLQTEIDYSQKGKVIEELEHFDYFYWLQNIRNLSNKSKVLMLQNKVENQDDEIYPSNDCFDKEKEFQAERPFKSTSVLNAFNYYEENHKFSYEFEELRKLIISKLNEVKRGEIFEYYLKAKELIEKAAQEKTVVKIEEFIEICKPANENIDQIITDEIGNETEYPAWKLMCVYFHETGVLLYYPNSPALKEKIFIRPTFATDSIYKLLNYQVKQNHGQFTFADAVKALDNNVELAKDIIVLMSAPNFKLIFNYPRGSESYIAPQYLDERKPEGKLLHHIIKNMEIGFSLKFTSFIPKFILTEFMVNYGLFQRDDIIWKYGIVFEKYGTTAFVECLFNECKIIYKSDNSGEFERLKFEVYECIRNINRNDKNLKIALDNKSFYPLDTLLSDKSIETFYLFREGYENYIKHKYMTEQELKGYKEQFELLFRKKNALEKDLILAYDGEKKFALQEQIKDLEKQIEEIKDKMSNFWQMQTNAKNSDDSKVVNKENSLDLRKQYCKLSGIGNINFDARNELEKVDKQIRLLTQ